MTDEERTDELTQKAKESYRIYSEDKCIDSYEGYQYIDGYCNGYEQGYEDCRHYAHDYYKPKWHDLRKNPDDLPKQITLVIMYIIGNVYCNGWFNGDGWIVDNGNMKKLDCETVIAWCELPKFEE